MTGLWIKSSTSCACNFSITTLRWPLVAFKRWWALKQGVHRKFWHTKQYEEAVLFSSQLPHFWASAPLSLRARTSTNWLRWQEVGKFLKESPSGIWKDVWQTGHLIVACSCLLAKPACLSRHSRQNEWRHGKVLGLLTVSKHNGHSASFWRFLKSCCTSMVGPIWVEWLCVTWSEMNCSHGPWTFYFHVTVEILARPLVDSYCLWQRLSWYFFYTWV